MTQTELARQAFTDPRAIALSNEGAEIHALCATIEAIPLTSQADVDALVDGLKDTKQRVKALEAQRRELTDPMRLQVEAIRDWFRPVEQAYDALERALKARVARFHAETRAAQQAQQAAAGLAFGAGDVAAGHRALAAVPPPAQTQGVNVREVPAFEVVNAGRVPLEFWSVDVNKIEAHVKQHGAAAVIPGVRVFMKPIVSVRA